MGVWAAPPYGSFADVMVQTADDERVLLAPDEEIADIVAFNRLRKGGAVESWTVPGTQFIGSFVFVRGGWLLLAIDTGLVLFDPATGRYLRDAREAAAQ